MSPSSPAVPSSFAHAVIRWSAADLGPGAARSPSARRSRSPRPPLHPGVLRRGLPPFFAFFGATSITARAIAARSPPGVSRPPGPAPPASAARASSSSSSKVAPAMISALTGRSCRRPAPPWCRAGGGAGSGPCRSGYRPGPGTPPARRDLVRGELRVQPARGSAGPAPRSRPACGRPRALRPGPTRTAPDSSPSETPANRSSSPAASAATASCAQPGSTSSGIPGRTRPPGWTTRRENPRGAGLARAAPPGGGRLHGQQLVGGSLADLGELLRGERSEVRELLRLGRVVVLAGPVQPAVSRSGSPSSQAGARPTQGPREPIAGAWSTTRSEDQVCRT